MLKWNLTFTLLVYNSLPRRENTFGIQSVGLLDSRILQNFAQIHWFQIHIDGFAHFGNYGRYPLYIWFHVADRREIPWWCHHDGVTLKHRVCPFFSESRTDSSKSSLTDDMLMIRAASCRRVFNIYSIFFSNRLVEPSVEESRLQHRGCEEII